MRRAVGLLAAVVLMAGGLVGCGIPDETAVRVRGSGPPPGLADGGDSIGRPPPQRGDTRDRAMFVANYLAAPAGNLSESVERVRQFLAPERRGTFKPEAEINVVRLLDAPLVNPGSQEVTLRVQHVGVLRANGALEPPTAQESTYTLVVSEAEGAGQGFYVTSPPPLLLMSDTALANYYQTRSIYFWNNDQTFLVPDLRYLANEVSREKTPTQILQWLTGGPSAWLADAVAKLPDGTGPTGNVVPDAHAGKLEIGLTAPAVPTNDKRALDRLGRQLMWSLRPNWTNELILKVAGQPDASFTGNDFLSSNPSYQLTDAPQRFCVYQGRVSRLKFPGGPTGPVPLVSPEINQDVRTAGLSRSGTTTYAALVVAGQRLVVGAARDGQQANFQTTRLPPGPISRPVWLTALSGGEPERGTGLIAAAGRLHRFSSSGVQTREVVLPGVSGGVTAVAVAADGYRIAYVAGGNLYVTVVTSTGTDVRAMPSRQVRTSLEGITAVDWSGEKLLVVAGKRKDTGRSAIVDVRVDAGIEYLRLSDLGEAQVSHLAAYPAKPSGTTGPAPGAAVTYVVNGLAYELLGQEELIEESEVLGAAPPANPPARPSAPFFLR